jgi:hypothetical protein
VQQVQTELTGRRKSSCGRKILQNRAKESGWPEVEEGQMLERFVWEQVNIEARALEAVA